MENEVKQLTLDTTYRYTGADFSDSIDDQADNYKSPEDVLDELTEDIKNEFSFQLAEDSYTEKLPYTVSMGAEFRVLKNLDFGVAGAHYASPYYKRDTYAFSANLGIRNALSLSPTMIIAGGDSVWACAAAFRFKFCNFIWQMIWMGLRLQPMHKESEYKWEWAMFSLLR